MLPRLPTLALCRVLALAVTLGLAGLPQALRAEARGAGHGCRCPKVAHECRCRHCRGAEQARVAAAAAADAKVPPCHRQARRTAQHLPARGGDGPSCIGLGCDGAPEDAPRLLPTEVFLQPEVVTLLRRPLDERLAAVRAVAAVRGDRPPAPPPRAPSHA